MVESAKICEVGGGGLALPLAGDYEQRWPIGLRTILYTLGLAWCFMGVAIIADVFMGAIERITSKKKRVLNPKTGRHVTELVWNATVANLTLMALGSSAPEILLSVIELFSNEFFSGELGPSTIVGSAAFNLLCITAVCVSAIDADEIRHVKEVPVYVVTASFSVFAYLWLLIILTASSENVIEVWEGLLTFLFFPILVVLAFLADKGYLWPGSKQEAKPTLHAEMGKEELAAMANSVRQRHGQNLTDLQVQKLIEHEYKVPKSRAQYRVGAIRELTGGRRVEQVKNSDPLYNVVPTVDACDDRTPLMKLSQPVVEFAATRYATLENVGTIQVPVLRSGDTKNFTTVGYCTRDGSAKAGSDYVPIEGNLEFIPGETTKSIEVKIIDDSGYEQDEEFYVDLCNPDGGTIGAGKTAQIVIIDDDDPGVLSFAKEEVNVTESAEDQKLELHVERSNGATGVVGCSYFTEDATAVHGCDYDSAEGQIVLEPGQVHGTFTVNIKARGRYDSSDFFRVYLKEAYGGAKFDPNTDGGSESCIMSVTIESDNKAKERIDRMMSSLKVNWAKAKVGHANWRDQFRESIYVNGGDEEADVSMADRVVHIVNLPWKLLCALVPPTDFFGGWACFICALILIGLVTALIGDLASLLGCCIGIPDEITAITFVALGTSLPDTFASKTAAVQDPYADASIGNVTGSNSVNVFLGLGLPWMIGSLYWAGGGNAKWIEKYASEDYTKGFNAALVVKAGNLGFSVAVFSSCAAVCIALLFVRRTVIGGELGGPKHLKYATSAFLVGLWFVYVGLSSWYILKESD